MTDEPIYDLTPRPGESQQDFINRRLNEDFNDPLTWQHIMGEVGRKLEEAFGDAPLSWVLVQDPDGDVVAHRLAGRNVMGDGTVFIHTECAHMQWGLQFTLDTEPTITTDYAEVEILCAECVAAPKVETIADLREALLPALKTEVALLDAMSEREHLVEMDIDADAVEDEVRVAVIAPLDDGSTALCALWQWHTQFCRFEYFVTLTGSLGSDDDAVDHGGDIETALHIFGVPVPPDDEDDE